MKIKILNTSSHPLPTYQTEGSAGMDIRAYTHEPITLLPFERKIIKTGIFIEIPQGYEVQIRPRSGLAAKCGVTVLNAPGTIDSDYRGEVGVILINLSDKPFVVENGERIAQMVVAKCEKIQWEQVNELSDSVRGVNGFGSTGK